MAATSKVYVVEFLGQQYLVRARTTRGAVKGLVASLTEKAISGARVASQDDLIALLPTGLPIIDVSSATDDENRAAGEESTVVQADAPGEPAEAVPQDSTADLFV